jgi:hypothetical protein
MPAWTPKDERQFAKVKESVKEQGASDRLASEIAARTVNKQRRREGRTPNKTTSGTGNPREALEEKSLEELRNVASKLKIRGRSKMNKVQLMRAIRESN